MFFMSKKAAAKKKLKKALLRQKNRRLQLIMQARAIHEKAQKKHRKKSDDNLSMGGHSEVKTMEQQDIAFAIGAGVSKTLSAPAKAIAKIKKRSVGLKKSKKTHLSRLKAARKTLKARGRG